MQDIGQELGRLSGESISFLRASWARTVAAASQSQQQLAGRLQQQQWLRRDAAAAGAAAGGRSMPQLHALDGQDSCSEDDYYRQRQQAARRSPSDADIVIHGSSGSSRAGTAWLGGTQLQLDRPGSNRGSQLAASAAAAGHSLLTGVQQAGRQLKATTNKLGQRLQQQQQEQQQEQEQGLAAQQESWEAAGATEGQDTGGHWQQQQQQPGTAQGMLVCVFAL